MSAPRTIWARSTKAKRVSPPDLSFLTKVAKFMKRASVYWMESVTYGLVAYAGGKVAFDQIVPIQVLEQRAAWLSCVDEFGFRCEIDGEGDLRRWEAVLASSLNSFCEKPYVAQISIVEIGRSTRARPQYS